MGNNDVPGYVELVFLFFVFSPEWCLFFPEWCQFSPEAKSAKLQKYMLQAVNQIFCSQHRLLAGWGRKQRTVPVEKIIIDFDTLFVQWRFLPELFFQPAGWNISANTEQADFWSQAEISARRKV
jgi:hypothetical protein